MDAFLACYSPVSGELAWAVHPNGRWRKAIGEAITVLENGTAVVGGRFMGTAEYQPEDGKDVTLTSPENVMNIFFLNFCS